MIREHAVDPHVAAGCSSALARRPACLQPAARYADRISVTPSSSSSSATPSGATASSESFTKTIAAGGGGGVFYESGADTVSFSGTSDVGVNWYWMNSTAYSNFISGVEFGIVSDYSCDDAAGCTSFSKSFSWPVDDGDNYYLALYNPNSATATVTGRSGRHPGRQPVRERWQSC